MRRIKYKCLKCKQCKKEFHVEKCRTRMFCSIGCATLHRHENNRGSMFGNSRKQQEEKLTLWQERKAAELHVQTLLHEDTISEVL